MVTKPRVQRKRRARKTEAVPHDTIGAFVRSLMWRLITAFIEKNGSVFWLFGKVFREYKAFAKPIQRNHVSLRDIESIQFQNQFYCLLNDLGFRQKTLTLLISRTPEARGNTVNELQSQARSLIGREKAEKTVGAIISTLETIKNSKIISQLLNGAKEESLVDAILKTAHEIDLGAVKTPITMDHILRSIDRLGKSTAPQQSASSKSDYRAVLKRFTDNTLEGIEINLEGIGRLDRIESVQALELGLREKAVLLLGEAGSGKTGVMASLAQSLNVEGECVIFIRADDVASQFTGTCTANDLSKSLGLDKTLTEIIASVTSTNNRVWLLLDQLDDVADEAVGAAFVQVVKLLKNTEGCIIIASCRSYEAEFPGFVGTIGLPTLHIAGLPPEEVCRCLRLLGLRPRADLVALCSNLLNLSLLATLAGEKVLLGDLVVEAQLWRALRIYLDERRKGPLLDFSCDCAILSAQSPTGSFSTTDRPKTKQLVSLGILAKMSDGRYRFRHERLRNYFVAFDAVVRRQESLPDALSRLSVPKSKTIIPWMVQIADQEASSGLEGMFRDYRRMFSPIPRKALMLSLPLVRTPSPLLAGIIWNISGENEGEFYAHESLCSEIPKDPHWAEALWEAGVFDRASRVKIGEIGQKSAEAVLELLPLVPVSLHKQVLDWIGELQTPPLNLTGLCAFLLKVPDGEFCDGIKIVVDWWGQSADEIIVGPLGEVHEPFNTRRVLGLFDIAKRLEKCGDHHSAVQLVTMATSPMMRTWSSEDKILSPRYRETFEPPDHAHDDSSFGQKLGIAPTHLIDIFRDHIRSIKKLDASGVLSKAGNPYACWSNATHLLAPGRLDRKNEWALWYGALLTVTRTAVKQNQRNGVKFIRELLESEDLLEVRIGLHLLSEFARIRSGLLTYLVERGVFKEPAFLGEGIRIFDKARGKERTTLVKGVASDLAIAIRVLDPNLPDHLSLNFMMSKSLIRWADEIAFTARQPSSSKRDFSALALFIVAHGDHHRIKAWSFDKLNRLCDICVESKIRSTTRVETMGGTILHDSTPDWESLCTASREVESSLELRFATHFDEALRRGSEWIKKPIGYAMLAAAQRWLRDKGKDTLYGAKRAKRMAKSKAKLLPRVVPRLLKAYQEVPFLSGGISPALRAQYVGLLSGLLRTLPDSIVQKTMPLISPALRQLALCRDPGSVRSYGQVFADDSLPMSTAAMALHVLIRLLWMERYGSRTTFDVLSDPSWDPQAVITISSEDDRRAITALLEVVRTGNVEIGRVFGLWIGNLSILDSAFCCQALEAVLKGDAEIVNPFVASFVSENSNWFLFRELRELFRRVIEDENANISDDFVRMVAWAYLIGWDGELGDGNLLFMIRQRQHWKNSSLLSEIVCHLYDSLEVRSEMWNKVRALWQLASNEKNMEELAGFWRCLQRCRADSEEAQLHVHVPEMVVTLEPLLMETCIALSSEPSYVTESVNAIVRYLANQSIGHEELVTRLMHICLGVDGKNYSSIAGHSEYAREVLRNAIAVGGEAKRLATEIIERHEKESHKSLVGLLL